MHFFKTLVLLCIFSLGGLATAQSSLSPATSSVHFHALPDRIDLSQDTTGLLSLNLPKREPVISLYNATHQWYDTYFPTPEGYVKSNTLMNPSPQTRFLNPVFPGTETTSLSPSLASIRFKGPAVSTIIPLRDSFNPYGTATVGDALVSGFLGLLFD